jgi:superfamily II DNA/RNA helicase
MTALNPSFAKLGVRGEIVRALAENGIQHPFAIQELTLPLALAGDDLIGQARTGMGKTFAFGVPLLHRIAGDGDRPLTGVPRALVVVPTRELCLQVSGDLASAAKYLNAAGGAAAPTSDTGGAAAPTSDTGGAAAPTSDARDAAPTLDKRRKLSVVSIYGGRPYEPQIEALRAGADVVVGTPGRLLDLAQQGHLQLNALSVLVLDEADEMLDLGFLPDIERILRQIPSDRQAMLFSATMPDPIITLARTFMRQPTHIRAEAPHSSAVHATTEQFAYRAHALDKVELVTRILQARGRGATMIFTRTKRTAQKVADELGERGFKVGAVHGDLGQIAREKALNAFRGGDVDVLVATDVAARGIDIENVSHVVNYQCPEDEKVYVHRIGRTGRAGRAGVAVTLVDWDELARWTMIDTALDLGCPDPSETYSSSPHLYAELDIPADVSGRVGPARKQRRQPGPRRDAAEHPARSGTRSRRRTRGGKTATGHVEDQTEKGSADVRSGSNSAERTSAEQESTDSGHTGRRRRRRRPSQAAPSVG